MAVTSDDPTEVLPRIPRQPGPPASERMGAARAGARAFAGARGRTDEAPTAEVPRIGPGPAGAATPARAVAVDPATELAEVPPPPEPLDAPWLATVAWSVPAVIMAAVGAIGVWSAPLSVAELTTWRFAATPERDFWTLLGDAGGAQAPYLVLMRLWATVAGTSDVALRLPSVLAMAAAAALVAALGVRLAGLRVGFAAGVLFAALPATARFAQDAGPDALALCAALAATLLLARLLDRARGRTYVGYAVAVALLGLVHAAAVPALILAHGVTLAVLRVPVRRAGAWLLAAVAGAVPVVPFAVLWIGDLGPVRPGATATLTWAAARAMPADLLGGALLAGAVLALAFVGASMRRPVIVATVWLFVTVAAVAVASAFTPLWEPRYLLAAVPGVVLLAAVALRQFSLARGLAVMIAVALLGVAGHVAIRGPAGHGPATRGVGAVLRANVQAGDAAIYGPVDGPDQRAARLAVARYAGPRHRPDDVLARFEPGRTGGADIAECAGAEVVTCLGRPDRVWVVRARTLDDPLAGLDPAKQEALRSGYTPAQVWRPTGFTIGLYRRTTG
jgi:mannosyltransferase